MVGRNVSVAFIGGGRTGTPLLQDMLDRPWVDVIGLADVNTESPGAIIARDSGVFVTDDAMIFAAKGDEIDVVIEVSGDPAVKRRLKDAFAHEGNRHTIIVHDLIARMMLTMVTDAPELVETFHPADNGVG
jgi:acetaldehyde dehydrogenase (acetylating)